MTSRIEKETKMSGESFIDGVRRRGISFANELVSWLCLKCSVSALRNHIFLDQIKDPISSIILILACTISP